MDFRQEWLNRGLGFVAKHILVGHVNSVHPVNLAGSNQKIPANS
jgi:hypothetical protein